MTDSLTGWLLDVYPNETNLTVWLIAEDGRRLRFVQDFTPALYAAGPNERLRQLWKWLTCTCGDGGAGKQPPTPVRLSRTQRRDVFSGMTPVLSVEVLRPAGLDKLFRSMVSAFPDLTWYDADISIPLRYMAAFDVFPLARVKVECQMSKVEGGPQAIDDGQWSTVDGPWSTVGTILTITPLDTPWELEPLPAPLRLLSLEPESTPQGHCDPAHAEPRAIIVAYEHIRYSLPLDKPTALLASLRADLRRYDPDVILSSWGDTWLLPRLLDLEQRLNVRTLERSNVSSFLPLNRDLSQPIQQRKEHTYFSYGQIVYRGAQVLLRGRWHLDQHNAMLWGDYGLPGVLEMARVTRQPVQEAARLSPGTGISSMQFVTALQNGILIPWHKHQAETPKTVLQLLRADMGGMVYQPTVGLHRDVGGIDFVSMYPGIMVHFNISPEVPACHVSCSPVSCSPVSSSPVSCSPVPPYLQGTGSLDRVAPRRDTETLDTGTPDTETLDTGTPGIIPRTLAPLLNKRLALKSALLTLNKFDCRRPVYQALASAHKWLLVTCFGYLGYKNARFGRIEAHEAVTAYGREALLRAKEAAEDMGFEILHMYVDGLWVQKPGCKTPADFAALLDEVTARTGLPISMDGVYRWVVFLPSRVNARLPVPNRYFGVFQDGSIKVRGIEARRHDTAPFIAETQLHLLEILARAPDAQALKEVLPQAHAYVRTQFQALRLGKVPVGELLVSQKLSRELSAYSSPSPAARAVWQMQAAGRTVRPGQRVRFLFTLGKPGVRAWDVPGQPDPRSVDLPRYRTLLERAVQTVLAPIEQSVSGGVESECLYLFPALHSEMPNHYS